MALLEKIFKKWIILLLPIWPGNISFAGTSTLNASGKFIHYPLSNLHPDSIQNSFEFINTNFENASPLNYTVDSAGVIQVSLVYDYERSSTNRANSHFHFQVQAKAGSNQTLILKNFDNIWNGRPAIPISEKTNCYVSVDGIHWKIIPTKVLSGNRLQVNLHMEAKGMYIASVEPYRISDLEKLIGEIKNKPLVQISQIGKTMEGRPLEIIRLGNPSAPYRIFLRARAHGFEAGGNWVVQGLIRKLLKNDQNAARYLKKYCLYIMPMANKDAVARGRSRFNGQGMDLNRKWDKPADAFYSPENYALENWFKEMIKQNKKPHLAIDLHNDNYGNLHISHPEGNYQKYLDNMKIFEAQLRRHTWFTEGSTGSNFKNPGTLSEGLLERYGIEALVYEFNYDWIAGLKKPPFGKDWEAFGEKLGEVFYQYFNEAKY